MLQETNSSQVVRQLKQSRTKKNEREKTEFGVVLKRKLVPALILVLAALLFVTSFAAAASV
jgi:hypothetical protein